MSTPAVPPTPPIDHIEPVEPGQVNTFLGHPKGLFLLFCVEMWERFSYYGMRALLVLYLIQSTSTAEKTQYGIVNPGRGWEEPSANLLYGWYTGLVYLLPIIGGIIADKMLGTHRSMVLGGILIAMGNIALAASGIGELSSNALGMSIFIFGLATIIIGTGFFKPCVSTMVGQLYRQGDPKRDGGFSIFYMGINLGAFFSALVCGYLGQQVGWHWGFGAPAVGMVAGLIMYFIGRPFFLKGVGLPPSGKPNYIVPIILVSLVLSAVVGYAYHVGVFGKIGAGMAWLAAPDNRLIGLSVLIVGIVAVLGSMIGFTVSQAPEDRGPTGTIFIFMMFNILFWLAFEQAGSTLNTFAERNTDLNIFGWKFPSTYFQSANAFFIVTMAPIFTWLWVWLARRNANPSQPVKIALGLLLVGIGYIPMVFAAKTAADGTLVSPLWLLSLYFIHTLGELCLSPTGLSYVTKAAPVRWASLLMGIWFISSFVANLGGGIVASQVERVEKGEIKMPWADLLHLGGRADYFAIFVISSILAGVLMLVLTPIFKKMMRDVTD